MNDRTDTRSARLAAATDDELYVAVLSRLAPDEVFDLENVLTDDDRQVVTDVTRAMVAGVWTPSEISAAAKVGTVAHVAQEARRRLVTHRLTPTFELATAVGSQPKAIKATAELDGIAGGAA